MRYQQLVFRTTPHSLVEWLDGELEKRGIDCVYTHCILSILQKDIDDTEPDEIIDMRNNQQKVYQKYGGPESLYSVTKSKHQKWKTYSKQILLTAGVSCFDAGISDIERKNRNAAINCLKSVSDDNTIEDLIDEVCLKLKNSKNANEKDSTKNLDIDEKTFYISPSSPTDQVEKYFAAFPPLNTSFEENSSNHLVNLNAWYNHCSKNVQDIFKNNQLNSLNCVENVKSKHKSFGSLKSIENIYKSENNKKICKISNSPKHDIDNLKFPDENSYILNNTENNTDVKVLTNMLSKYKKDSNIQRCPDSTKIVVSANNTIDNNISCKKCRKDEIKMAESVKNISNDSNNNDEKSVNSISCEKSSTLDLNSTSCKVTCPGNLSSTPIQNCYVTEMPSNLHKKKKVIENLVAFTKLDALPNSGSCGLNLANIDLYGESEKVSDKKMLKSKQNSKCRKKILSRKNKYVESQVITKRLDAQNLSKTEKTPEFIEKKFLTCIKTYNTNSKSLKRKKFCKTLKLNKLDKRNEKFSSNKPKGIKKPEVLKIGHFSSSNKTTDEAKLFESNLSLEKHCYELVENSNILCHSDLSNIFNEKLKQQSHSKKLNKLASEKVCCTNPEEKNLILFKSKFESLDLVKNNYDNEWQIIRDFKETNDAEMKSSDLKTKVVKFCNGSLIADKLRNREMIASMTKLHINDIQCLKKEYKNIMKDNSSVFHCSLENVSEIKRDTFWDETIESVQLNALTLCETNAAGVTFPCEASDEYTANPPITLKKGTLDLSFQFPSHKKIYHDLLYPSNSINLIKVSGRIYNNLDLFRALSMFSASEIFNFIVAGNLSEVNNFLKKISASSSLTFGSVKNLDSELKCDIKNCILSSNETLTGENNESHSIENVPTIFSPKQSPSFSLPHLQLKEHNIFSGSNNKKVQFDSPNSQKHTINSDHASVLFGNWDCNLFFDIHKGKNNLTFSNFDHFNFIDPSFAADESVTKDSTFKNLAKKPVSTEDPNDLYISDLFYHSDNLVSSFKEAPGDNFSSSFDHVLKDFEKKYSPHFVESETKQVVKTFDSVKLEDINLEKSFKPKEILENLSDCGVFDCIESEETILENLNDLGIFHSVESEEPSLENINNLEAFESVDKTVFQNLIDDVCSAFKPVSMVEQNYIPASSNESSQNPLMKAVNIDRIIQKINGKNRVTSGENFYSFSPFTNSSNGNTSLASSNESNCSSKLFDKNLKADKFSENNYFHNKGSLSYGSYYEDFLSDWSKQFSLKNENLKSIWKDKVDNSGSIWGSPSVVLEKKDSSISLDDPISDTVQLEKEQAMLLSGLYSMTHLKAENHASCSNDPNTASGPFQCPYELNIQSENESVDILNAEEYLNTPQTGSVISSSSNTFEYSCSLSPADPIGMFSLDNCKNDSDSQISCSDIPYDLTNEPYHESDFLDLSAFRGPYGSYNKSKTNAMDNVCFSFENDGYVYDPEIFQERSSSLRDLNTMALENESFQYMQIDGQQFSPEDSDLIKLNVPKWPKGNLRRRMKHRCPPFKRPCAFYMEGCCNRTDCKFSHDLSNITCRFWQEGSCFKGSTCPFLHGYAEEPKIADHILQHKCEPEHNYSLDSEADFPSLSSSKPVKTTDAKSEPMDIIRGKGFKNSRQSN